MNSCSKYKDEINVIDEKPKEKEQRKKKRKKLN